MQALRWEPASPRNHPAWEQYIELGLDPIVAGLLVNRGIEPTATKQFLNPSFGDLHQPNTMHDMVKAAKRIALGLESHERIAIYGDYDVDGVTSTATLYHALRHFGITPRTYIPHRRDEGYGINPEAVRKLAAEGITLIVSVDCGITAIEPAAVAKELGVDLIITDHHQWKESLPEAYALVHPRLGDTYENKELCGAGVAFKVAWALGQAMSGETRCEENYGRLLMNLLAFTALGTIADVVPLIGENRSIAVHGLRAIPNSPFIGMQALLTSARLKDSVDGYQVGFTLAPRLNAAGRMGHAQEALEMFTWAEAPRALAIAQELERKNKWRQETQRKIVEEAKYQAQRFEGQPALVVVGESWHPGVVGIVASRLIDDYYCPTIVLSKTMERLHGSARSIEGFDLSAAIKSCEDLLTRWGGHAMAAGLELHEDNLDEFRRRLCEYVAAHCPPALLSRKLDIDSIIELSDLSVELVENIKRLGPFGSHNRRPLFAFLNCVVSEVRTMGSEGKHLMLRLAQGGTRVKCVMWNRADLVTQIGEGSLVNVAAEPEINEWRDRKSVELLARDLRIL